MNSNKSKESPPANVSEQVEDCPAKDSEASSSSLDSSPPSGYSPSAPSVCSDITSSNSKFKLSYAQSNKAWPPACKVDKQETAKSILAPSKLGPSSKSIGGAVLKPSSFGTSRLGPSPFTLPVPTVTISSTPSDPKPAFKLKPSVLGAPPSSSSSSLANNPFSVVASSKEEVGCKSPIKVSSSESEQPESKRICTRSEEFTTSPESPIELNTEETDKSVSSVSPSSEEVESLPVTLSPSGSMTEQQLPTSSQSTTVLNFVPLSSTEVSVQEDGTPKINGVSSPLSSNLGSGGFIFGQNLSNRISGMNSNAAAAAKTNGEIVSKEENLFTEAATSLVPSSNAADGGSKTLSESSREFSEKEESLKRKYEEVAVVTGEETEKNVIQMNCKLYGWVNGCWQERGRGILRLNDREVRDELHSRIVIRTAGTLTLMLNAKIWAEMSIEKSNDKSVRFTATSSDGQPKIYLVMGTPKDISLLHNSLEYRVAAARSQSLDEKERKDIDL